MKSESILNKLNTRMARWFRVTCEDTTPLILEVMDHGLPLGSRIRLAVHLAMCGVCGFYKKQIEVIRALANKLGEEDSPVKEDAVLSPETKKKIKQKLRQTS